MSSFWKRFKTPDVVVTLARDEIKFVSEDREVKLAPRLYLSTDRPKPVIVGIGDQPPIACKPVDVVSPDETYWRAFLTYGAFSAARPSRWAVLRSRVVFVGFDAIADVFPNAKAAKKMLGRAAGGRETHFAKPGTTSRDIAELLK